MLLQCTGYFMAIYAPFLLLFNKMEKNKQILKTEILGNVTDIANLKSELAQACRILLMSKSQILTLVCENAIFSWKDNAMLFSYQAVFLRPQQHSQVQTNQLSESTLYQLWSPQKICTVENTKWIRTDANLLQQWMLSVLFYQLCSYLAKLICLVGGHVRY